ncbi:hypothetical protein J40TS1_15000 [Paenibacillus montaniterrae]|uniref:Uncharacterized protein n=1 Tax=Paenibacillus montaniterrae TaxID=429341 RepID=A0A919YS02_9BACL|nr:hypothetical protein J40TS1_15000 [Paenibacillus montaniterrae]
MKLPHKNISSTTAAYNDPHSAGMFESIGEDGAALNQHARFEASSHKDSLEQAYKSLQRSLSIALKAPPFRRNVQALAHGEAER